LGNGKNILFWEDVWAGNIPLRLESPKLYDCCSIKNILVCDCWYEGEWRIDFRRSFGTSEVLMWEHLMDKLKNISISDSKDQAKWVLEKRVLIPLVRCTDIFPIGA